EPEVEGPRGCARGHHVGAAEPAQAGHGNSMRSVRAALVLALAAWAPGCRGWSTRMKEDPMVSQVVWLRVEIAGAGISMDQHPGWPALTGEHVVYQRFS